MRLVCAILAVASADLTDAVLWTTDAILETDASLVEAQTALPSTTRKKPPQKAPPNEDAADRDAADRDAATPDAARQDAGDRGGGDRGAADRTADRTADRGRTAGGQEAETQPAPREELVCKDGAKAQRISECDYHGGVHRPDDAAESPSGPGGPQEGATPQERCLDECFDVCAKKYRWIEESAKRKIDAMRMVHQDQQVEAQFTDSELQEEASVIATEFANMQCAKEVCVNSRCAPCGNEAMVARLAREKKDMPAEWDTSEIVKNLELKDFKEPKCFARQNGDMGECSTSEAIQIGVGMTLVTVFGLLGGYIMWGFKDNPELEHA